MNKWLVSISLVLGLAVSTGHAADVEAGKTKSASCLACHGPDDFKSGARKNDMMAPMAAPLTDAEIDNLAAYFNSQIQKGGTAAADKVELGEKLFRAGNSETGVAACMACHGPAGLGNPAANFPQISGQHAAYLEKAMKDFRSGSRTNDVSGMMQGVVARMTDAEIAAVAQYVQGLK